MFKLYLKCFYLSQNGYVFDLLQVHHKYSLPNFINKIPNSNSRLRGNVAGYPGVVSL